MVVTGGDGSILEWYRYDAFGAPTIHEADGTPTPTSLINNRFLFTGREYAPAKFGFYEYRARAYNPRLGRFMSEDPKGFDGGDYNLYRYCLNDPWDETDPMGMEPSPQQKAQELPPRPKPKPFTSTVLEGPGTPGAASGKRPLRYAPVFDRQGKRVVKEDTNFRYFPWELQMFDQRAGTFNAVNEKGWENEEHKVYSWPPVSRVLTSGRVSLGSRGILWDKVGLFKAPEGNFYTEQIFGHTAWRNGFPYKVSTQFKNRIYRIDKVLYRESEIYNP